MYLFTATQAINYWFPPFCAVLVFAICALGALAAHAISASRNAKQQDKLHAKQIQQRLLQIAIRQRLAQITAQPAM